ncbi:hypothetical protein NX059_008208 [Plenodomus lindquistii]|nr:hypothetical protein NX059_008208 [Plenodomus lindquistii]
MTPQEIVAYATTGAHETDRAGIEKQSLDREFLKLYSEFEVIQEADEFEFSQTFQ